MKPRRQLLLGIFTAGFFALLIIVMPLEAQRYSNARIVRLSFVEGEVTVQRPDAQAWSEAPVNTPLQQSFKISTGENSFAEIQFEDGGAIRLGELAVIEFQELGLTPDGGRINRLELSQGYATFHLLPSRLVNFLQVQTPYGTLDGQGGAEFRVDLEQGMQRVEVFRGAVQVQSNLGGMTVEKDSVLLMRPGAPEPTVVSQGIAKDDWDRWVDNREALLAMSPAAPSPSGYTDDASEVTYGWNDLQQYGTWSNVPGMGFGWTPTLVTSGWAPYSGGQWCWYPGTGYTWIGAEPWGWLPYHYGGWNFIPGTGWVWFPGSFATWSPGQVTWFKGPGWVGWIPRPHRKDGAACGNNCGGGVVSSSTLQRGGVLNSSLMLGLNPTTGERAIEPGIVPSVTARMAGPAVSFPAAQAQGFRGNRMHAPAGTAVPAMAANSPESRRSVGAAPSHSPIVYDPQEQSYVNAGRVTRQQGHPAPHSGASVITPPAANPGLMQSMPVGNREQNVRPAENLEFAHPKPVTFATPHPAPSASNGSSFGARPPAGQAQTTHAGGGSAAAGHAVSAPAGGGHSAPSGGGAAAGHH